MADTTATHVSIGELLGVLADEFPDITISKIRFLESQGLIDPERTPSGYRKFYDADVERLRWILREQKDNFLPLKVIRTRLEQLELGEGLFDATETEATTSRDAPGGPHLAGNPSKSARTKASKTAKSAASSNPSKSARTKASKTSKTSKKSTTAATTEGSQPKRRRQARSSSLPPDEGRDDDLVSDPTGASLTRDELAHAAGITDAVLADLEAYGLVSPGVEVGGRALFDEDALAVARLAGGFAEHGIDARHLRMYRAFAEREAVLYQQTLVALLRQRNPEARARARAQLAELAKLGRGLRTTYLRSAARELLSE